jgi:hypothetical protein
MKFQTVEAPNSTQLAAALFGSRMVFSAIIADESCWTDAESDLARYKATAVRPARIILLSSGEIAPFECILLPLPFSVAELASAVALAIRD